MAMEGDKWRVRRGDCLWNIAAAVYNNGRRWGEIADANGISRKSGLIYPGQLFILPGITAGTTSGGTGTPAPTPPSRQVDIQWWALDAGTTRDMFCVWEYTRENTAGYNIEVWYDTGAGGWRNQVNNTTTELKQYACSVNASAKKVKFKIKPYAKTHTVNNQEVAYWTDGEWKEVEYNFENNPPLMPDVPTVELDDGVLTCSLSNIDPEINGNQIEFAVYKNNDIKYKTGIANINTETRYVSFVCDLEPGNIYTVRCRAIRNGNIYSNWTDYTGIIKTLPLAPNSITDLRAQVISEQGSKQYGVYVEWDPVQTASNYKIEYTTNPEYFDAPGGNVESVTTEENDGNRYLISNIELGHEYYFRVCSVNETGDSPWTGIKSVRIGSRPSAPTTWSYPQNCEIGEDLNLYWTHNSTDGSLETIARLHITAIDLAHPELNPLEFDKVIHNNRPEEDRNRTSVYTINTTDPEWSFLSQGFIIKWKVQTAGVAEEYSEWSIEREINVYLTPELTMDIKNQNGQSVDEISSFPFYISVSASPNTQTPISYYIEIVTNQKYETIDNTGRKIIFNQGDKVYQKYYDPQEDPWDFLLELTPANLDLKDGISYTINAQVGMNSSLTANATKDFSVIWSEQFYEVDADIILNKETLEASIHPMCYEYYEENEKTLKRLTDNCKLAIYRREYNGNYTLIAKDLDNNSNVYITDPHPSLDYARYRITATSTETGSISYADIDGKYFGIKALVIQWDEDWVPFETSNEHQESPNHAGSMVFIPYNLDINQVTNLDLQLVNYVGREHPVSYYGTQVDESFSANADIPKDDTDLIYALRRLSKYKGDVYVRESSGVGYWANVNVQMNIKHNSPVIPVSFAIKRVEGGM